MYIRYVSFAYFLFYVSLSRSNAVLFDFSEHKKWFFPAPIYTAWSLPSKPRFLRRFFCSLQRKYCTALCVTKGSYPKLLLSWGSYAVKNSVLIFLHSYSFVTHLLLIQRFLTYFFYDPIQNGNLCSFSSLFSPTLPNRGSYRENFIPFFYFSACRGHFLPSRDFYRTNFQSNSLANGDSYRKKTAFAPLPCRLQ